MAIRMITLFSACFILLISGFGLGDRLLSLDGELHSQDSSRSITANEDYSQLALSATYGSRDSFLFRASWQWMCKGNDLADITLTEASNKGLLPFWVLDPKTKDPVRILTAGNPSGSDVILLSEAGGLGCELIHGNRIDDPGAESTIIDTNSSIQEMLDSMGQENVGEWEARREEYPPTDWGIMMEGLKYNIKRLVPVYVSVHQTMPTSLEQLLGDNYILNQDFLDFAKSLIDSGESSYFECGVIPDESILYFDCERQEGMDYPVTIQYGAGGPGFDIYDPGARVEKPWPRGLSLGDNRIVLISDKMLAEPEKHFSSDIVRPLSDFYNAQ